MKQMDKRVKNIAGQKFGEWTVQEQIRTIHYDLKNKLKTYRQWFCICSCGTEQWLTSSHLRRKSGYKHCGKSVHKNLKFGCFTVIKTGVRSGDIWILKCKCERLRTFSHNSIINHRGVYQSSCGCNGVDPIIIIGDPNLPNKKIKSFSALIKWIGISRQAFFSMKKRKGFFYAREHLIELAKKRCPENEWKIKKIIPSIGETNG